ncbi:MULTISPECIES: autoinducer 2 ABC transporter permease LsrC [Pseudovibrio]|uniref:autoinducer 2 ABC transporter permease LsrC n=1 Tax=Stappiaceae TaxID=2821832 RepID=UPI0023672646|nr:MULTISPECIES: autoinducer 2 ABC transporter permease LsrC [Pseudovibrio]MDD7908837.1 autoinducer 2 ABC transporter permease LsrC [Pseudovibrio exalbescens]MDX5593846.1 autoinducer 2 ABC transporter permease LsrC [Pseudovibrio sp. SPO723]
MLIRFLQTNREASVAVIILLLFVVLGVVDTSYLSFETVLSIYNNSLILLVIAIGATLVMATRGLDVSIGSIMGLSAAVAGILMNGQFGIGPSIAIALFVGLLCGLFNGFMVAILRVPAIVATLGTLGLYRGLVHLVTSGSWIEGLPEGFKGLSHAGFLGLSAFAWIVLFLLVGTHCWLRYTAFGRSLFAVGDNREGARLLGIKVRQVQLTAYAINGVLAALAGIIFAAQIGFIPNTAGNGMEMRAIASSVLGGVSLLGGTGTVIGAGLGAYFMTSIDSVLVMLRLDAFWNDMIAGGILLVVLIADGKIREAMGSALRYQKYRKFIETDAQNDKSVETPTIKELGEVRK